MHIFMRSVFALACALLVVSQAKANLFGADEPLPPLEVFVPSIERVDNEHISIRFSIEEAYYLYRDKLAFTVETINPTPQSPAGSFDELISGGPGNIDATANKPVTLHSPVFEDATIIEDDFFGQQAIFRNSTLVHIPYSAEQQVDSIEIGIRFQGCADIGLCYPPTDTTLVADMSAATSHFSLSTSSEAPLSSSSLASVLPGNEPQNQLRDLLSNDEAATDLLPPELAFLPQIIAQTQDTIDLTWFIEDGYYLYRDKLSFSLDHPPGAQVTKVLVSEGLEQHDEFFGNVFVLRNRADVRIHLDTTDSLSAPTSPDSSSVLTIRYQGCADLGVCFPPKVTTLDINPGVDEIPATIAGLIPLGSNISGAKPAAGARATAENSSLTKVAGKSDSAIRTRQTIQLAGCQQFVADGGDFLRPWVIAGFHAVRTTHDSHTVQPDCWSGPNHYNRPGISAIACLCAGYGQHLRFSGCACRSFRLQRSGISAKSDRTQRYCAAIRFAITFHVWIL